MRRTNGVTEEFETDFRTTRICRHEKLGELLMIIAQ